MPRKSWYGTSGHSLLVYLSAPRYVRTGADLRGSSSPPGKGNRCAASKSQRVATTNVLATRRRLGTSRARPGFLRCEMKQLRTLVPFLLPYRWAFLAGMAWVVVANVFAVLPPKLIGMAIDALSRP